MISVVTAMRVTNVGGRNRIARAKTQAMSAALHARQYGSVPAGSMLTGFMFRLGSFELSLAILPRLSFPPTGEREVGSNVPFLRFGFHPPFARN